MDDIFAVFAPEPSLCKKEDERNTVDTTQQPFPPYPSSPDVTELTPGLSVPGRYRHYLVINSKPVILLLPRFLKFTEMV